MVYVQLQPGATFEDVEQRIKTDPYFVKDRTYVFEVEDVSSLMDTGHGVLLERNGVSGITHNQSMRFQLKVNNPALTAQVMVSAARAAMRQQPGMLHHDRTARRGFPVRRCGQLRDTIRLRPPWAIPYTQKMTNRSFFAAKSDMRGRVVVVLRGTLENRSLALITPISRAFPAGSIIELIGTDEATAGPGGTVEKIAYIAFVELIDGGVLLAGDPVFINGTQVGTIVGFDDTHVPNHQNTILRMEKRIPGDGPRTPSG